jgi:uncharacterized YigZ family protein
MSKDFYTIPARPSDGEFRDRGSKFLAVLRHVKSEDEALAVAEACRKAHPKVNHHCYAYRLGPGQDRWRANDDGEPSSTAGKPILGQIDKAGISDVVIVVSRYFGGTKLGTSGLINAYRESALAAIEAGETTLQPLTKDVTLRFGYDMMSPVMSALSSLGLEMAEQDFADTAVVRLELPRSTVPAKVRELKAAVGGVYLEEVDEEYEVEGFVVEVSEPLEL